MHGRCYEWRLLNNIMSNKNIIKVAMNLKSQIVALRERDLIVDGPLMDPLIATQLVTHHYPCLSFSFILLFYLFFYLCIILFFTKIVHSTSSVNRPKLPCINIPNLSKIKKVAPEVTDQIMGSCFITISGYEDNNFIYKILLLIFNLSPPLPLQFCMLWLVSMNA